MRGEKRTKNKMEISEVPDFDLTLFPSYSLLVVSVGLDRSKPILSAYTISGMEKTVNRTQLFPVFSNQRSINIKLKK